MPYVFYDTETTGTETAFDQILQFAAIKTDDGLVTNSIALRITPNVASGRATVPAARRHAVKA